MHFLNSFFKVCSVFVECAIGFFAKDCKLRCPYPSYGDGCQGNCNCQKTSCDYVFGCFKGLNFVSCN